MGNRERIARPLPRAPLKTTQNHHWFLSCYIRSTPCMLTCNTALHTATWIAFAALGIQSLRASIALGERQCRNRYY